MDRAVVMLLRDRRSATDSALEGHCKVLVTAIENGFFDDAAKVTSVYASKYVEVLLPDRFLFSRPGKTDCINSMYYYLNPFIKKEHRVVFKFNGFFEEVNASFLQGLSIQLISGDFLLPSQEASYAFQLLLLPKFIHRRT